MSDVGKFIEGIGRFQKLHYGDNPALAEELKSGQNPKAMLIGCSDSRVDPALLTDCAPGDLFMVRNVANLVPPYSLSSGYHGVSSALEYAVCFLEVENIIVLGHSGCGGIAGLMQSSEDNEVGEFIGRWVHIASSAKEKVLRELPDSSPERQAHACEKEAILVSLDNLLTFPWIRERVEAGKLTLHGWYYNIKTGQLKYYNREAGDFEVLVDRYSPTLLNARENP
ncbi:MAG: carbonic anhydrase [Desulfuromonas sp.]|nr:MAG: carbonic anhydrase [Desulfuromonas sp.]